MEVTGEKLTAEELLEELLLAYGQSAREDFEAHATARVREAQSAIFECHVCKSAEFVRCGVCEESTENPTLLPPEEVENE